MCTGRSCRTLSREVIRFTAACLCATSIGVGGESSTERNPSKTTISDLCPLTGGGMSSHSPWGCGSVQAVTAAACLILPLHPRRWRCKFLSNKEVKKRRALHIIRGKDILPFCGASGRCEKGGNALMKRTKHRSLWREIYGTAKEAHWLTHHHRQRAVCVCGYAWLFVQCNRFEKGLTQSLGSPTPSRWVIEEESRSG